VLAERLRSEGEKTMKRPGRPKNSELSDEERRAPPLGLGDRSKAGHDLACAFFNILYRRTFRSVTRLTEQLNVPFGVTAARR